MHNKYKIKLETIEECIDIFNCAYPNSTYVQKTFRSHSEDVKYLLDVLRIFFGHVCC